MSIKLLPNFQQILKYSRKVKSISEVKANIINERIKANISQKKL